MQGWRQPQPSGTNRPSSYPSHPRGRCFHVLGGCNSTQVDQDIRSGELAVRPPGHAEGSPEAWEARERLKTSAAHRSAAMAGGARPDPFRTRKLSRRAPMVLRGKPVGEQGAADRWTALDPFSRARARGRRGGIPPAAPPFFHSCVPHLNFLVFLGQREMRGFSYVRRPRGHALHRGRHLRDRALRCWIWVPDRPCLSFMAQGASE